MRHDLVHKAKSFGLVGRNELAGGEHLEGFLARDIAAQGDHWGRAEEADIHTVDAKLCALGGDGHVAGRDELTACGGRDAVDLCDDRLRDGLNGHHHLGAAVEKVFKISLSAIFGLSTSGHLFEVVAGAEDLAFA